MVNIGIANGRNIFYQKYTSDGLWDSQLSKSSWLLFVVASGNEIGDLSNIARLFIENDGYYACCAGDQGEMLHDIIDDEIITRDIGYRYLPAFDIISTWHNLGIEDGLWSAIYTDGDQRVIIDSVVCLDASREDLEFQLRELVKRFNDGYVPPL